MKKVVLLSALVLNLALGITELEQNCNVRNDMSACNNLVIIYAGVVSGLQYLKDEDKKKFYENKICDFGGEYAPFHCHNIALGYLSKAKNYIKRTCNLTSSLGKGKPLCEELRKTKLY